MIKDERILQLEENLAIEKNKSDYYILALLLINRVNELEYTIDDLTHILEIVRYLGIGASMVDGKLDTLIENALKGTDKEYIYLMRHYNELYNFSYNIKVTNQETIVRTKYQNKFGEKIEKVKKFKSKK